MTDNQTPNEATQKLWEELVVLREVWNQYDALYRNSDDAALLVRSARWFFRFHKSLLTREIMLRIARLTDDEETAGRQNLVLKSILKDPELDAVPEFREDLKRELEELCADAKPVGTFRHKYLAHLDRAIAAGEAPPLPPVPWALMERLINSAEHIYHQYRKAVYDSDVDFRLHALGGPKESNRRAAGRREMARTT